MQSFLTENEKAKLKSLSDRLSSKCENWIRDLR